MYIDALQNYANSGLSIDGQEFQEINSERIVGLYTQTIFII